jgi:type II secretory pathway component GspD/PulD (secretin)
VFKHLIERSSQTARIAKSTTTAAVLLLSSAIAGALPSGADSPASELPQYWIKVAIVHDQKTLATPTVLVTEGTEAGISVDAESETTVNGKSTERDDSPAF